jgi:hypothetical protein
MKGDTACRTPRHPAADAGVEAGEIDPARCVTHHETAAQDDLATVVEAGGGDILHPNYSIFPG